VTTAAVAPGILAMVEDKKNGPSPAISAKSRLPGLGRQKLQLVSIALYENETISSANLPLNASSRPAPKWV